MSLTAEAKKIPSLGDVIREHWPTRDDWASARKLGGVATQLRFRFQFTHQAVMQVFAEALGVQSIDPIEFDEVMFMADDQDGS